VDSTNTESAGVALSDSAAQPVSIVYARAFTPGSSTVYTTDYHCNHEVYVNRSSASSVNLSVYDVGASDSFLIAPSSNTYTISNSDDNPYGLSYDSGGTPYAGARGTGAILNIEYWNSPNDANDGYMSLDSNNGGAASPSPWSIAADDLFSADYGFCSGVGTIALPNIYASHSTINTVTRYSDGQNPLADFVVGATSSPGPEGLLFDRAQGVIWVALSNEASLTQINKNLMIFTNESNSNTWGSAATPGAGSACLGSQDASAPGTSVTINGYGFDTSTVPGAANPGTANTILLAGYMAVITGAAVTGSSDLPGVDPVPTSLTFTIPNAPHGIKGPIILSNQGGQIMSYCTYTTQ
jgi:hypothetical protein